MDYNFKTYSKASGKAYNEATTEQEKASVIVIRAKRIKLRARPMMHTDTGEEFYYPILGGFVFYAEKGIPLRYTDADECVAKANAILEELKLIANKTEPCNEAK